VPTLATDSTTFFVFSEIRNQRFVIGSVGSVGNARTTDLAAVASPPRVLPAPVGNAHDDPPAPETSHALSTGAPLYVLDLAAVGATLEVDALYEGVFAVPGEDDPAPPG
jgi:hypothetical protein